MVILESLVLSQLLDLLRMSAIVLEPIAIDLAGYLVCIGFLPDGRAADYAPFYLRRGRINARFWENSEMFTRWVRLYEYCYLK